ncbi:hypothetical protein GWK47_001926 [Chionoecetes opilio]|uniref:Uncharacterized protein n=1 Tax=Chionoecetes opilio TaxID=41210 RepID=A0A8J4Y0N1_CHIOP|nr:hypothetical protein GWK47_001926 [Chionoecetes opilio]
MPPGARDDKSPLQQTRPKPSSSPAGKNAVKNGTNKAILLEGRKIHLQESVNILGVEFDSGLTYTSHVKKVAKDATRKLSCIPRVAHLLDASGVSAHSTSHKSAP